MLRWRILSSVKSGWSYALNQDGRVVAVFIMLDMVDYLSMPVIHSDSALFEMLGKYGKVVEQKLRQREWKRG